jgi:hypothetical protein
VLARFARHLRASAAIAQRSGVSARFTVAGAETVAAAALTGEDHAVARSTCKRYRQCCVASWNRIRRRPTVGQQHRARYLTAQLHQLNSAAATTVATFAATATFAAAFAAAATTVAVATFATTATFAATTTFATAAAFADGAGEGAQAASQEHHRGNARHRLQRPCGPPQYAITRYGLHHDRLPATHSDSTTTGSVSMLIPPIRTPEHQRLPVPGSELCNVAGGAAAPAVTPPT